MEIGRRAIGLTGLALGCSLFAPAANAQMGLVYAGQSNVSVNVSYTGLPASTQIFIMNRISGVKWPALVPLVGGSGSLAIPMPAGPGHYTIIGQNAGDWVAQTVVFYAKADGE